MSLAVREAIARFHQYGGSFYLDGDTIRYRVPKGRPEVQALLDTLRACREEVSEALRTLQAVGTLAPAECPLLPKGVRLVKYAPKTPPVAIAPVSIVNDVRRFIEAKLAELDARLNNPIQIRAGDGVFGILAKLAEVGVELAIEVPDRGTPTKS